MNEGDFSRLLESLHPFFTLLGEVSGSLLGLLFVAVTLRPDALNSEETDQNKSHPKTIFRYLLYLVWLSLLLLIPNNQPSDLGIPIVIQGVYFLILEISGAVKEKRSLKAGQPSNRYRRIGWALVMVAAIAAGICLIFQQAGVAIVLLINVSFCGLLFAAYAIWNVMARDK
jgi:hypothetical protein